MDTGLDLIRESGLLADQFGVLAAYGPELSDTFVHSQQFRTRTEMEVSVLGDIKFPTADAKYWQAVREQDVQFTALVLLSFEYKKLRVETEQLRRKLATIEDDLERELLEIEIQKNEFLLMLQEREGYHRVREIEEWSAIKTNLRPHCAYPLDDVNAHQLDSFRARFRAQAQMLTPQTAVADRINIESLHRTAERVAGR